MPFAESDAVQITQAVCTLLAVIIGAYVSLTLRSVHTAAVTAAAKVVTAADDVKTELARHNEAVGGAFAALVKKVDDLTREVQQLKGGGT